MISGNGNGIRMQANNNVIQGNYIGINAKGAAFNYGAASVLGVSIFGSTGNTVGGATPAARNVISGHTIGLSLNNAPRPSCRETSSVRMLPAPLPWATRTSALT